MDRSFYWQWEKDPKRAFRQNLKHSLLFMAVGALVMALFNRAASTDYCFMTGPSTDSPFAGIYAHCGYSGYLFAFLFTVLLFTALWYSLRYILNRNIKCFLKYKKIIEKNDSLFYNASVTQLDHIADRIDAHKNSMSFSPFGSGKTTCSTCISCGYKVV